MKGNNVTVYAFQDIVKYNQEHDYDKANNTRETWNVTGANIFTKESKRLNRELNITGLNKIGNTNNKRK